MEVTFHACHVTGTSRSIFPNFAYTICIWFYTLNVFIHFFPERNCLRLCFITRFYFCAIINMSCSIKAETSNTFIKPELKDFFVFFTNFWLVHVEVRHIFAKETCIITHYCITRLVYSSFSIFVYPRSR